MHSIADKSDLFPVTAAPFAKHEVEAQPQPLPPCQFVVKRFGLEPSGYPATWPKFRQAADKPFRYVSYPIHCYLLCKPRLNLKSAVAY